ncbi:hypothetical protein B566_EDAN010271 [Ephemera danica]|nr:hypothetical protein B566_EDAN010271 [Ephemera danica]
MDPINAELIHAGSEDERDNAPLLRDSEDALDNIETAVENVGDIRKIPQFAAALAGSIVGLGAAVAAPMGGIFIDKIGRRNTMVALTLPFALGWILVAFAVNLPMLCVGRILTGASGGAYTVAGPIYISEIAHPSSRGTLSSIFQLMVVLGLEFTYLLGPAIPVFWLSIASSILPLLTCGFLLLLAPESPVYLLRVGRVNGAYASLSWLRGSLYDINPELSAMSEMTNNQSRRISIERFSGINDIVFYTEEIFKDAGGSVQGSKAAILVGASQVISTLISTIIVDRAGRRVLLILSGAVMAACCTALGLYFQLKAWGHSVSGLGWLPLSSLCLYFLVFSLGFGPIPWVMLGELFAPDIKGIASSIVSSVCWFLTFLTTFVFQDVVRLIGEGVTFWVFGGMCVLGVIFTVIVVPETKGKSLNEIQRELGLD